MPRTPCKDGLYEKLGKLKPLKSMVISTESERNRALKYARTRGLFFVTRTHKGALELWRLPED